MTLRIRRGTDAQRQNFTPDQGELLYVTDTQELYVGDGTTTGGLRITGNVEGSPALLTQNLGMNNFDITGTGNIDIDGTIEANNFIGSGSQLTNLPIPYDPITNLFTGQFSGDGSQLTNLPDSGGVVPGETYNIALEHSDGSDAYNPITQNFYGAFNGTFIGDGSQLTNLNVPAGGGDGVTTGETYKINIAGEDSTILVDAATNTHQGTFNGTLQGTGTGITSLSATTIKNAIGGDDLSVNIIAADTTVLLDYVNQTFQGTFDGTHTGTFTGDGSGLTNVGMGDLTGTELRVDIISTDSTKIVDYQNSSFQGTFNGTFNGNGSGLTNLPDAQIVSAVNGNEIKVDLAAQDSTVIFDSLTKTFSNSSFDGIHTGTFTGTHVGDGSLLTNIDVEGQIQNTDLKVNLLAGDSSVAFDWVTSTFTGQFNGTFIGDGSQLTNLPDPVLTGSNQSLNIISADGSTILVNSQTDSFTGSFYGSFVGDGSQLTNLPIVVPDPIDEGSTYFISIAGADSTTLLDANVGVGFFDLIGDVNGSVFADDSSWMVDGANGHMQAIDMYVDRIIPRTDNLTIAQPAGLTQIFMETTESRNRINMHTTSTINDMSAYTGYYGVVNFGYNDTINGRTNLGTIRGSDSDIRIAHDLNAGLINDETKYLTIADGDVGIGTYTPQAKLDVQGEISTSVGVIYAGLTTAERDALSATAGAVVFNSDTQKMQVYVDDTGLAGGGSANSTPGWIDMY